MKRRITIAFDVDSDSIVNLHDDKLKECRIENDIDDGFCKHDEGLTLLEINTLGLFSRFFCSKCRQEMSMDWKK